MFKLRSWASSRMIVSYRFSFLSWWISLSKMPSVMSLTRVLSPT